MSFNFYDDSARVLLGLSSEDAGKIVQAIMRERLDGTVPEFDAMTMAVYILIKGQVDRAEDIRESRSASGKRGGSVPKQSVANEIKAEQNETNIKQTEANESTITVTKAVTVTKAESEAKGDNSPMSPSRCAPKSELEKALDDFTVMRTKIKKPATPRAMTTIRRKLQELAPDNEQLQILIIEQSIEHCWQTVYPLKDTQTATTRPSPTGNPPQKNIYAELAEKARAKEKIEVINIDTG